MSYLSRNVFLSLILGVVKFVGVLDEEIIGAPLYVGVQLDDNSNVVETDKVF